LTGGEIERGRKGEKVGEKEGGIVGERDNVRDVCQ